MEEAFEDLEKLEQQRIKLLDIIEQMMSNGESLKQKIIELKKKIEILELKNKSSLANNLCPDHRDKQAGKSCLACEIEKLQRVINNLKKEMQRREDYIESCLV